MCVCALMGVCVIVTMCVCVCVCVRSLSALGNVIQALVTKQAHVPFRDSKLTYLLQDSLGKDNKTLMIVQVSPMLGSRSESVCSLNFASRVQKVELGKAKTHGDSEELIKTRALVCCCCQHGLHLTRLSSSVWCFCAFSAFKSA